MIARFRWFIEDNVWRFVGWVMGPWRICYNCEYCEEEFYLPDDTCFYCDFRNDLEVDPNDKGCRAFKGWRKR